VTSRERQLAAIRHEIPDQIPIDVICIENQPEIAELLGIEPAQVYERPGIDGRIVSAGSTHSGCRSPARRKLRPKCRNASRSWERAEATSVDPFTTSSPMCLHQMLWRCSTPCFRSGSRGRRSDGSASQDPVAEPALRPTTTTRPVSAQLAQVNCA
jgi:hypothetical protein